VDDVPTSEEVVSLTGEVVPEECLCQWVVQHKESSKKHQTFYFI